MPDLRIDEGVASAYADVFTADALNALKALVPFDAARRQLMQLRLERRASRARERTRIAFLDPATSLDNQRNLKLAIHGAEPFTRAAEQVAREMNAWAMDFLGRRTIEDLPRQLRFTTKIFRPRGLHLDDRHVYCADGSGFSASIV